MFCLLLGFRADSQEAAGAECEVRERRKVTSQSSAMSSASFRLSDLKKADDFEQEEKRVVPNTVVANDA